MTTNTEIKPIAFYLPQYHCIPENDEAHGKGFTEWTNVRKAQPLFPGHNQPRIPLGENYYNLLDIEVLKGQVETAKKYNIYGFCYYHYWFSGGKKLLEKPVELMLEHKEIDMPFCLCWANENWTKRWDGGNNEVIVAQDYGDLDDIKAHMDYLCEFFRDDRYIQIDGKPLLLIYKPELIPHLGKYIRAIRKQAAQNGIPQIVLAVQYPKYYLEGAGLGLFDYYIQFQPRFIHELEFVESQSALKRAMKKAIFSLGLRHEWEKFKGKMPQSSFATPSDTITHRDYDADWKALLNYEVKDRRLIAGAFVDWDNSPRNSAGLVYDGTTPEKFREYIGQLKRKIITEYDQKYLFVNAWNEWAEGAYLEPDTKNEYGFLEAFL